jgi:hypothetical protein
MEHKLSFMERTSLPKRYSTRYMYMLVLVVLFEQEFAIGKHVENRCQGFRGSLNWPRIKSFDYGLDGFDRYHENVFYTVFIPQ